MKKIKRCVCCNRIPKRNSRQYGLFIWYMDYMLECPICKKSTGWCDSVKLCIKEWNKLIKKGVKKK